jgi:hypothetical protein
VSAQTEQHFEPSYQQPAQLGELHGRLSFLRGWVGLTVAGLVALGAVIVAVALFTGGSSSSNRDNAFNISYPSSWNPLSKQKLAALPGHPVTVLRRNDGQGLLVIRRQLGTPPADLNMLGADFARQLRRRDPSLKIHTQKIVEIRSGQALYTSYISKKGTVQTVIVVPAGKQTYTINTFSRGGADNVAREIGKMILSFDATP